MPLWLKKRRILNRAIFMSKLVIKLEFPACPLTHSKKDYLQKGGGKHFTLTVSESFCSIIKALTFSFIGYYLAGFQN